MLFWRRTLYFSSFGSSWSPFWFFCWPLFCYSFCLCSSFSFSMSFRLMTLSGSKVKFLGSISLLSVATIYFISSNILFILSILTILNLNYTLHSPESTTTYSFFLTLVVPPFNLRCLVIDICCLSVGQSTQFMWSLSYG